MARYSFLLCLLLPLAATAADDPRVSFLEAEVRNLKRDVQSLQRQLDAVVSRPDRPASPSVPASAVAEAELPVWVNAAKWRAVHPGMSELDVIAVLGKPNSLRSEGSARVLLYALEIGSSGFLGGSVVVRDRAVAEVRPPTLQ